MLLYEADKSRARIHQGIPVLGVQDSGFALGYRFNQIIGLMEYRMNNLQPWEYARIVGYATASLAVMGTPQVGSTISATVGALSQFTYTITSTDMAASDPIFSAATNFSNNFNAANGSSYIASAQPEVSWPITTIGTGPKQWQIAFVSFGAAAFTLVTSGGTGLVCFPTAQGLQVQPSFTFQEDGVTAVGYLNICDYLQSKTAGASDLAKFAKADVVTMRYDELGYRDAIYDNWRQKLADYWGIPLFPMDNSGPLIQSGTLTL